MAHRGQKGVRLISRANLLLECAKADVREAAAASLFAGLRPSLSCSIMLKQFRRVANVEIGNDQCISHLGSASRFNSSFAKRLRLRRSSTA
jgi:hypothetical protein